MDMVKREFGFEGRSVLRYTLSCGGMTILTPLVCFSKDQYTYQINRKWKLKKTLPSSKKRKTYERIQGREEQLSGIEHRGRNVDRKMQRYVRDMKKQKLDLAGSSQGTAQAREEPVAAIPILGSKM